MFTGEAGLICPGCDTSSFDGTKHLQCKSKYGLDGLANVWEYEGIAKKLLGIIKYQGITHAIRELVKSSFQLMAADQARFAPFLKFLLTSKNYNSYKNYNDYNCYISYVPMFQVKEKNRGFNQAQLIAKEIAFQLRSGRGKIEVVPLLIKTRDTGSQTQFTKEERAKNVENSFVYKDYKIYNDYNNYSVPESIVLVDDIYTTGATMKECAKVLKKAGVKNVWGFTLARTP